MKKGVIFAAILILLAGMFTAQTTVEDKIKESLEKQEINNSDISNISKVSSSELPEEISIQDFSETDIDIYKVETSKKPAPVFVITQGADITAAAQKTYYRQFLDFGFAEESNTSEFLKTSVGVSTENSGYVMTREGSITGISTNLEITDGKGEIEILIYKNGEEAGFRNDFIIKSDGVKKDFDLQSRDIVNFEPGDTISVYLKNDDEIAWKNAITLMEIETQ